MSLFLADSIPEAPPHRLSRHLTLEDPVGMRGLFRHSWAILVRRFLGERPHLLIAEQHTKLAGGLAITLSLFTPRVAFALELFRKPLEP